MTRSQWIRVRRDRRCPICKKPDWCLISVDGNAAICARIESERPAGNNGSGWIHRLDEPLPTGWTPPQNEKPKPDIDWTSLSCAFTAAMNKQRWSELSGVLGITTETLEAMNWGWSQRLSAWTVPMRTDDKRIIGIRTRLSDGSTRSVYGSRSGLFFIPDSFRSSCLIICEGPTDIAALIDSGFDSVVGRPSCRGGTNFILRLIRRKTISTVLLIPDRDPPGISGAETLATTIVRDGVVLPFRIDCVLPPAGMKDCRDWQKNDPENLAKTIRAAIRNLTEEMESRR